MFLVNSDIDISYRSDHSPIKLEFNFIEQDRGSLLEDQEYIKIVKDCISDTLNQYKSENGNSYSINDQLLWETIKLMIRGKTISYASLKKKERDKLERELESKLTNLQNLSNNSEYISDIEGLERQLKEHREQKNKGIILRAKARWHVEGEKSTKYFCNLE